MISNRSRKRLDRGTGRRNFDSHQKGFPFPKSQESVQKTQKKKMYPLGHVSSPNSSSKKKRFLFRLFVLFILFFFFFFSFFFLFFPFLSFSIIFFSLYYS